MRFRISKEMQIGLLVLASIAIFFFGFNYLKGINVFRPTNYYYCTFKNINGLVETSTVTSHGHKVGLVKSIEYNYDDPSADVVIELQVDNELKIPKGSRAVLEGSLMGNSSIVLDLRCETSMNDLYTKGDTIPSVAAAGMLDALTTDLMPKMEQVIPHLDQLIISLNTVVSDPNIAASLSNINKMSNELAQTSASLKKMVSNDLPPILSNAQTITGDFTKVSANLSSVDFKATMGKVDNTMNGLSLTIDKINSDKGTLGLLLNDRKLYDGLNATVTDADRLLIDLREHPKRYVSFSVFSKKEKNSEAEAKK